jgi:hypothetical protein
MRKPTQQIAQRAQAQDRQEVRVQSQQFFQELNGPVGGIVRLAARRAVVVAGAGTEQIEALTLLSCFHSISYSNHTRNSKYEKTTMSSPLVSA